MEAHLAAMDQNLPPVQEKIVASPEIKPVTGLPLASPPRPQPSKMFGNVLVPLSPSTEACFSKQAEFIDTVEGVQSACKKLQRHHRIVVDLEGVNLCRDGRVCILQVASEDGNVYVFDITKLALSAFTAGLGALLQDQRIIKLLYDARQDLDALWHQFRVHIAPLIDLQVAHVSAFNPFAQFVPGLKSVLERQSPWLTDEKRAEIASLKEFGVRLFAPELGGSYAVWDERPLRQELFEYACADVALLFNVCDHALAHLPRGWGTMERLMLVSKQRSDAAILAVVPTKGHERARRDFLPVQGFMS